MRIHYSCTLLLAMGMLFPGAILAKKPFKGNQSRFDYIIVGFGSAGAILARQLSNDLETSVLVIEAGPNNMEDPATLNPNPLADFPTLLKITYNPNFAATYPYPFPNSLAAGTYSEGKEWGGGAAHNYGLDVRGLPEDYNQWGIDSANPRWFYPNLLPFMKALETYTPDSTIANPAQRGFSGPISVTQSPPINTNPFNIAISEVTGAPFVSDYNDSTLSSISVAADQAFVTPGLNSIRSFSASEFDTIGEIIDEKGRGLDGRKLRVRGNSVVSRLLIQTDNCSSKVVGVEYLSNRSNSSSELVKKAYARKKVILCAGSVNSPAICIRSGIGPVEMVNAIGVDLVVDSPHMGQNLQNHYGPTAIVTDTTPSGPTTPFIDARPYMPADGARRIQILGGSIPGGIRQLLGFMVHPQSRGSIEVVSKDPLTAIKINLNMFNPAQGQDDFTVVGTDAYVAVSYYKIIKAIADEAGEVVLYPAPAQYATDALLYQAAISPASLAAESHITGTARMGTDISNGAVDGDLNVFGVTNLIIADNSVPTRITGGNTCWQAYMVGVQAAEILGVSILGG